MNETTVTLFERLFAVTIAFVLPGMIALFGIATGNATVENWFKGAQNGPTMVGFLFVLFAALALNVVITATRWYIFEGLHLKLLRCPWVDPAPNFSQAKRKEFGDEYAALTRDHYYHYLAYANTAVAIPIAVVAWKLGYPDPQPTWWIFGSVYSTAALASWVLGRAACNAVQRFDRKAESLLGLDAGCSAPRAAAAE
jgi:hypothetical protein